MISFYSRRAQGGSIIMLFFATIIIIVLLLIFLFSSSLIRTYVVSESGTVVLESLGIDLYMDSFEDSIIPSYVTMRENYQFENSVITGGKHGLE